MIAPAGDLELRGPDAAVPVQAGAAAEPALEPVYVWYLLVRTTHWVVVASVLVLSITGIYIGRPFESSPGPGAQGFIGPAAPHHAPIDGGIPKGAVALLEQAVVRRAACSRREGRLVAEGRIEHVGDVKEFMAEEGQ